MPLVPTVPVITAGPSTLSQIQQLADVAAFLAAPPIAELRQIVVQTLTTGVGAAITFTAEGVDTDVDGTGGHSTSSNTSRYTARYPGWYQVSGVVAFAGNVTGRRISWWTVNGVPVTATQLAFAPVTTGDAEIPGRTAHVYLAIGDYVELIGYQESGGNLDTLVAGTNNVASSAASIRWARN